MATASRFVPRDSTQTDLIRYFNRNLVTPGAIDRVAIEARARHARAAMMGEFIGAGLAWLWRRMTHLGETRSPSPRSHVEGRVPF